jgi:geranylgeranyl pyrophosphate synthase
MENSSSKISKSINLSPKQKLQLAIGTNSDLAKVEEIISSKFQSSSSDLIEISKYLNSIGGKRIRPILTLLVAQSLNKGSIKQSVLDVAAGIELIHMATLLHDDIIDKSPLRRHETSPWLKFGTGNTLLCGDFLLTRAYSLCARLDHYIINKTEVACVELTEGEIEEKALDLKNFSIEESLEISRKKTASLFRLACDSAAHLSNEDQKISDFFAEFGENLGIAFQVLDDILDFTSTEDLLGKKAGIDVVEKKPSIPNILWKQSSSSLAKKIFSPNYQVSEEDRIQAIKEVINSNIINECKKIATQYSKKALNCLNQIDTSVNLENKSKEALIGLTTYILDRME